MAPPRKPSPKFAAPSSAPRGGGRARPPQGEAGQGRGSDGRRAPSPDGNRGEGRGRFADEGRGNSAPRGPRAEGQGRGDEGFKPRGPRSAPAGTGRGEEGRYGEKPRLGGRAPTEQGRPRSGEGLNPRGPRSADTARGEDGYKPRGPRSAPAGRGEESRYGDNPRQGRNAAEQGRPRSGEGYAPRGPRGADAARGEEGYKPRAPRTAPAGRGDEGQQGDGRRQAARPPRGANPAAEGSQGRRGRTDNLHSKGYGSIESQRGDQAEAPRPARGAEYKAMDEDARREARRAATRLPPVNIADLPVEPAKKLRQRHGSEKQERQALELREKRVDAKYIGDLRIQKALALSGVGSRRDCDAWVAEGRVSINGQICQPGARVVHGDKVMVDGKPILIKWPDRLPRVVLYHKQEGELVSRDDPEGRTTVFERLPKVQSSAWVAVGRLDFNTSGLLIFTTSGDLANRLMHPRFEVQREYAVRVLGQLTDEQKKEMVTGIELEDGTARFEMLEDQGGEGMNHWYRVILKEGRNREVRRMFEHYELTVSRLMRVRFGMLTLPSRLKRGQYYELDETEVLGVLKWAGLGLTGRVSTR